MFVAKTRRFPLEFLQGQTTKNCLPYGEEGFDIFGGVMKRTKVMIHTIAFVAIVMIGILLAVITISAETYTGIAGFDITWTLDTETGVMEFSGEGSMDSFKYGWNKYASSVKTVIISDGITSIGENAFRSCENLTEVRLSRDLEEIGEGAFWGCKSLTPSITS